MAPVAPSYLTSLTEHVNECERDLLLLRQKLDVEPWSRFEELAAIGAAKHWSKSASGQVINEALKAFQYLETAGLIAN